MSHFLYNRINRNELRRHLAEEQEHRTTLSFYAYARLEDPSAFRDTFFDSLDQLDVLGRIYVAREGVNAQLSVPTHRLTEFREYLDTIPFLRQVRLNIAVDDNGKSFFKLTIKVRHKIVADGLDDDRFDVTDRGTHLSAADFNTLTDRPDTIVVDMRNHYESEVGHFQGAVLPPMETFREGLPMVIDLLKEDKDRPVVMYCTGGIRCEKASAYLKHNGFRNVYQLDGGIIEYTRQAERLGLPNKFIGKNFVFDERLGERISTDIIASCHQCGAPCDTHTNCANDDCHLLFIQCESCRTQLDGCCSVTCRDYNRMSPVERASRRGEIAFNGQRFSKSRPGLLRT